MMKKLAKGMEALGGILVGILFFLVLFQVIARVILRIPTSWTVELGRVLFVGIVFIGSGVLVFTGGHMVIKAAWEKFPPKLRFAVEIFNDVLVAIMLVLFCWGALEKTISNWHIVIPTLEWMRNGYMYLLVFLGGLVMLVFTVNNLMGKIRRTQ